MNTGTSIILFMGFVIVGILLIGIYTETVSGESGLDCGSNFKCAIKDLNIAFKGFWHYNISEKSIGINNFSMSRLEELGGVCWSATKWYINKTEELGYLAKPVNFYDKNKTSGHTIAILYDENLTEYCVVDQTTIVGCQELKQ